MSDFEFCPLTDTKANILKDLSDFNNTKSKSILNSIKKIKINLEKNNTCETRKLSEKQIEQLKRLEKLYKNFKENKHTDLANKRIEKLFWINNINIKKLKIHKLFKKYFWNKEIKNRWDINSLEFMKKLYNAIDRWEINQIQKQKILQYWYYLAFKSEIKSIEWKKWIENIKKYEKQWKDIFYNELKNVLTEENTKNLFLLSWVEWNGQDQSKNPFGAIWWFQILLSTAKSIDKSITEKDLHDPIKSAKIAAKYIKILIEKEKNNNPNLDEINIIKKAITKYNWNFSSRLLESKRTNIDKTIFELFKNLNWIKTKINNYKSIDEIKEKLKYIHKKYFKPKKNKNSFHFWILEEKEITKEKIVNWINRYIKQILKQQSMYPIQFNAIKKVYNDTKKAN